MKIKLLDRDDIRRFGGTVVDVPDHVANKLLDIGRASRVDLAPLRQKQMAMPPMNKAMWRAPEDKAMNMPVERYPKASDSLFPKRIIP